MGGLTPPRVVRATAAEGGRPPLLQEGLLVEPAHLQELLLGGVDPPKLLRKRDPL